MELFLAGIGVLAVLAALYWRWKRRLEAEIAEGADFEWRRLGETDPEILGGLDRARFAAIYRRVHFPRFPGYALACLASFIVSLPASFGLLAGGLFLADKLGLTPETADVADLLIDEKSMRFVHAAPPEAALYFVRDLGGFYYFFGVLLIWLLIVAVFMRRYHARRPGYLRDEILRAR